MILLTGAAGFIGSNILKALNAQGRDDIICVDDLTDGSKCKNLADKKFWRYYDWRELFNLLRENVTAVIHQGAISDTTVTDGRAVVAANYQFSVDLLDLAFAHYCPVVYASTAAIYGIRGRSVENFKEEPRCEYPASPYAVSKKMFDDFVRRKICDDPDFTRVIGLRYFNVYGPGEQHKGRMASVAYKLMTQLETEKSCTIFDGSECIFRDFVYVDDVVRVVLWALKDGPSGIYNVGTGTARSFYDVAQCVLDVGGIKNYGIKPKFVKFPDDLRDQYQRFTQAHLERLSNAGYTHQFDSLEIGLKKYWQALYP